MRLRRAASLAAASLATVGAAGTPGALAAQPRPVGTILVADLEANALFAIDPATGQQTVIASGGPFMDPEGLVVDPLTCDAIVSDAAAAKVFRVSLIDGTVTTVAAGPPLVHPVGGILDGQGNLLSSDEEAFPGAPGGVIAVNLTTGAQTPIASGGHFVTPLGVALAPDGTIYVADADAFADGRGGVIAVDRATGTQTVISEDPGPSQHPQGILWWEGRLLLTDMARSGLYSVDVTSGVQTPIAVGNGLITPREIEGDGPGSVLVADASAAAVTRVDLATGSLQTVSSGGLLRVPFGIAKVPACPETPSPPAGPPPTSPPSVPGTPARDVTAPDLRLRSIPASALQASLTRGIRLRLALDGPATVRVELRRPTRKGKLGSRLGPSVRVRRATAGAFSLRVKASKASLRRLLRTDRRLSVRVVATDPSGNEVVRTRTIRVRSDR